MKTKMFLDLETTGLHLLDNMPEIVEFGYLISDSNYNVIETYNELFYSDYVEKTSHITKIYKSDVSGKQVFCSPENLKFVAKKMLECDNIIAFNADFDIRILVEACKKIFNNNPIFEKKIIDKSFCLQRYARERFGVETSMSKLYNSFFEKKTQTHRALDDVKQMFEIYKKIIGE